MTCNVRIGGRVFNLIPFSTLTFYPHPSQFILSSKFSGRKYYFKHYSIDMQFILVNWFLMGREMSINISWVDRGWTPHDMKDSITPEYNFSIQLVPFEAFSKASNNTRQNYWTSCCWNESTSFHWKLLRSPFV